MEHHFFKMVPTQNGMALEPWRKLDKVFRSHNKPLASEGGSTLDVVEAAHNARVMVSETPDTFQVRVDLPQTLREGLRLLIKDNFLILTNTDSEDLGLAMSQGLNLPSGKPSFLQAFPLPSAVLPGRAKARLHNGALYVTVPKAPESAATEVKITLPEKEPKKD